MLDLAALTGSWHLSRVPRDVESICPLPSSVTKSYNFPMRLTRGRHFPPVRDRCVFSELWLFLVNKLYRMSCLASENVSLFPFVLRLR